MNYILLPFLNVFLLYISLTEGQILYKPYDYLRNNIFPRLPISDKILGGCIMCTSFWMGFGEIVFFRHDITALLILFYNAVATAILYNLLSNENSRI